MARGPVPSKATFLLNVAKPECFDGKVSDDIIAEELANQTDIVVASIGDRVKAPVQEWDGFFVSIVCRYTARALIGSRGYKPDPTADSEFIEQAQDAKTELDGFINKEKHPYIKGATSEVLDAPLGNTSTKSDAWVNRRHCCR